MISLLSLFSAVPLGLYFAAGTIVLILLIAPVIYLLDVGYDFPDAATRDSDRGYVSLYYSLWAVAFIGFGLMMVDIVRT
jgi:hypothetical protein